MGQVDAILYQHLQVDVGELVVLVIGGDFFDVDAHAVDAGGDHGNHAAAVFNFYTQFNRIFPFDHFVPAQCDQPLSLVTHVCQVLAALPVHHHTFFGTEVSLDGVAGNRVTAAGIVDHEALSAADCNRMGVPFLQVGGGAQVLQYLLRCDGGQPVTSRDLFQQVVQVIVVVTLEIAFQLICGKLVQAFVKSRQGPVKQTPAQGDGVFPGLVLQEVAYIGSGFGRHRVIKPGGVGAGARSRENFYGFATLEWLGQRCQPAIDAAGHAAVAHVSVHGIGEVHCRGTARQLEDPAFGGEHINLVGKKVDLDAFDKFQRVARSLLHLQQALYPLPGTGMAAIGGQAVGFVKPVCSDAIVRHGLHFPSANLDFNGHAVHAHQYCV